MPDGIEAWLRYFPRRITEQTKDWRCIGRDGRRNRRLNAYRRILEGIESWRDSKSEPQVTEDQWIFGRTQK